MTHSGGVLIVSRITSLFKKESKKTFGNPDGRPKIEISEKRLLYMKDSGKSNREIAKIIGVSEATIRRRLKESEEK